jgi:hypothetical protein
MSSYRFCDNTQTPLFNAAVSGTSPVTAGPVKVTDFETFTFQATWGGSLAGVITVLGSLDGVNFYAFGVSVPTQPAGSSGGCLIPLFGHGMKWLELVYTNATGAGNLTVTSLGKTR